MGTWISRAHVGLLNGHKARDDSHELVLIEGVEDAVEHELGCQKLVAGADLASRAAFQGDNALRRYMAQLSQHRRPVQPQSATSD